MTEITLTLRILAGLEVTGTSLVVTELASSSLLEPFCGTFSCLKFWHCFILSK
jgi:hypothetical protein